MLFAARHVAVCPDTRCRPGERNYHMAILDSTTGKVVRDYSVQELKDAAKLMRGYDLVALCAAGSGHAGGTLSIMDIAAALYLKVARLDPTNAEWSERDRIIFSTGHKAPS